VLHQCYIGGAEVVLEIVFFHVREYDVAKVRGKRLDGHGWRLAWVTPEHDRLLVTFERPVDPDVPAHRQRED
jgi:hypothetical protein